ncbi:MAG: methyltransferase family protein, partial [Burkholderiaceae bacterium]
MLDLATGYQRSKTLFALVEFGVPTMLAGGALSLEEIARRLQIHRIAADRFLNAGVALGLLERADERFRNTPLSDQFLVKGKPGYLGDGLLKHDRASYPQWMELARRLREWQPGTNDDKISQEEDQGEQWVAAQHNLALLVGHALADAYDFSRHQRMLDLGGGTGAMSISICTRHKDLRSIVFDLPDIV